MAYNLHADGLRGLASLNVVCAHFAAAFLPWSLYGVFPTYFQPAASGTPGVEVLQFPAVTVLFNGHFAVVVFFVLSGYVLSLPFHEGNRRRIWQRLAGRYVRLNVPIAVSVLLSFVLYSAGMYVAQAAAAKSESPWLKEYFPTNLSFGLAVKEALYVGVLTGKSMFNEPLWTLRVEFLGSLLLLVVCGISPRKWLVPMLMLAVAGVYWVMPSDTIYFAALLSGSLLGYGWALPRWGLWACGVAGIFLGAFSYGYRPYEWFPQVGVWERHVVYHALGGFLLVTAVTRGWGGGVFGSKLAQYLGKISFGMYLMHFLVIGSLASWLYVALPQSYGMLAVVLVAYVAAVMGVAHLFWWGVDRPAIKWAKRLGEWVVRGKAETKPQ